MQANPEKTTAVLAVGTLQNLAAESNANKEAIREAGGIPILVSLIKAGPDTPVSPILPSHGASGMFFTSPGTVTMCINQPYCQSRWQSMHVHCASHGVL